MTAFMALRGTYHGDHVLLLLIPIVATTFPYTLSFTVRVNDETAVSVRCDMGRDEITFSTTMTILRTQDTWKGSKCPQ